MANFALMFAVALAVGALVYFQVQKASARADAVDPELSSQRYMKFCDILEDKLRDLKRLELGDESARESYLDELEALSKELVYIKTMHQSNLNPAVWEGKLFEFLNKTDALIEKYAASAERSLQDWRKQLEMEFKNL